MKPKYIADFEKGNKVLVLDRESKTFLPEMSQEEFVTLNWMQNIGSLAMEAAHGARISSWSAAQRWETENDLLSFWKSCQNKGVELRFLPEAVLFTYRKYANLEKSGQNDLLAYDNALSKRPRLWESCQRPENVRFHDRSKDINSYDSYTPQLAGFQYRNKLKDSSRLLSASEESNKYKNSKPGQLAYIPECVERVASRLKNHNSKDSNITNGIATFTFQDGTTQELSLLDVLGIEKSKNGKWKSPKKDTQYVTCMMLLLDMDGNRYINVRTGNPVGWRTVKQYGMVSSSFHKQPGFLRPKYYHNGIKPFVKKIATEKFGTTTIKIEGDDVIVPAIEWTNEEHAKFFRWIRNTCRIAYEQTTKEMKNFLNDIDSRSNFLYN